MAQKFEIGKKYVVELRDSRSVHILRPYSTKELLAHNIGTYGLMLLKFLVVLVCVAVPPLLIPLLIYYKGVDHEKDS